ncbi:MAG TPA: PQQ-dependent sugar dehydrogenase, partial [Anaerolineaceae bacterium]
MAVYRITVIGLVILLLVSGCSGGVQATGTPAGVPQASATQPLPPALTATTDLTANSTASPTGVPTLTPAQMTATQPTLDQPTTQAAGGPPAASSGATVTAFPDPAGFTWVQVASGIMRPTAIAFLPGGSGSFLALSQPGVILIYQKNQALAAPFLDLTSKVGSNGNEQGLLGIALHPQFQKNGYFYINYTDKDGNTVIARFQVSASNPNQADPGSEKVLLRVNQPFANHNGGSMVFGPDGYLYMGLGDGGSQGDPSGNGQRLDTYLAKILRVDVDHGDPYTIPASNPFAKGGGKPEIWAYGLRNPWRFSFDRLTGELYIADVGQDLWEEIDYLPANAPGGTNFGWNYREGSHAYRG